MWKWKLLIIKLSFNYIETFSIFSSKIIIVFLSIIFNVKLYKYFNKLNHFYNSQEHVLANLVVEEEPGGDERVGEDSQDESTIGSTSAPRLNPVAPDEDTLPSSVDGHESPTAPELSASAFSVDSDCSNSSIDSPLLPRREPTGTKRKAEVLSKESGKIGVTITTSSPSSGSGSPPPNKIPRLLPLKSNPTSPSYHVSIHSFLFFSSSYRVYRV